jgi:hypothetical protein
VRCHLAEADSVSSAIGEFDTYWSLRCGYCGTYTKFVPEECAVETTEVRGLWKRFLATLGLLTLAACATTSQSVADVRTGLQDATAGLDMACPSPRVTPGCTIVRVAWRTLDKRYQTLALASHEGQDVSALLEEAKHDLSLFWQAADAVIRSEPYEEARPKTLPSWGPCETNPYRAPRALIDIDPPAGDLKTPAAFEEKP